MSQQPGYFKIGLFVMAGAFLLVAGLIVMGAGNLFKSEIEFETYIDESVQGLEVGSPVKYRGVKIGRVTAITTVRSAYQDQAVLPVEQIDSSEDEARYILIRMAMSNPQKRSLWELRGEMLTEVEKGLRVRLSSQGITGGMYLETDYYNPREYPPLNINWTPECVYVPSVPSVYTTLMDSVDGILATLQRIPADEITSNTNQLLQTLDRKFLNADVEGISTQTRELLSEIRQSNEQLQKILLRVNDTQVIENAGASMQSLRSTASTIDQGTSSILTSLDESAAGLSSAVDRLNELLGNPALDRTLDNLGASSSHMVDASEQLPDTVARFNQTLKRIEALVVEERHGLSRLLERVGEAAGDMRDLTGEVKQNPGRLLLGKPPKPVETQP